MPDTRRSDTTPSDMGAISESQDRRDPTALGPHAEWDDREMGVWLRLGFGFMLVVATAALAWAAFST